MSKDKKKESNQKQELSEWQKRNQEYLKKKAEEEAALAEEKEKEKQARKEANSKLLEESRSHRVSQMRKPQVQARNHRKKKKNLKRLP